MNTPDSQQANTNRDTQIRKGDRVRLTCGNLIRTGLVEYVDHDWRDGSWDIEIRSEHDGKVCRLKQAVDGGTVEVEINGTFVKAN